MTIRSDILAAISGLVGLTGEDVTFRTATIRAHVGPVGMAEMLVEGGYADNAQYSVLILQSAITGADPRAGERITVRGKARDIFVVTDHVSHWELLVGDETAGGR